MNLALDPLFLAGAIYPITIDPSVLWLGVPAPTALAGGNHILEDSHGNVLTLLAGGTSGAVLVGYSTTGGSWTSTSLTISSSNCDSAAGVLDANNVIYWACGGAYGTGAISYDAAFHISGVSLTQAATYAGGTASSLVLDKFGQPVVAWVGSDGSINVGRPGGFYGFMGIQGNIYTSPDVIASSNGAAVSLVRMPAGSPSSANDDAIYLFYAAAGFAGSGVVDWTKATVSGQAYNAWGTLNYLTVAAADPSALSTAQDVAHHAIVVAAAPATWCPPYGCAPQIAVIRKLASNDADSNNQVLNTLANAPMGTQPSVSVDRGDVYVAFQDSSGYLAYQGNHTGTWDANETVLDWVPYQDSYPSLRRDGPGDGNLDFVWTTTYSGTSTTAVNYWRLARGPQISGLTPSPQSIIPLLNQFTTLSYGLSDTFSGSLTVTARVYPGWMGNGMWPFAYQPSGTPVRTLNASGQAQGNQSLAWDGKDNSGVAVPPGYYTVALTATDSLGATSTTWGITIAVAIGATATYGYDHLNRLTSATVKSQTFSLYCGPNPCAIFNGGNARVTTYGFDLVGNRTNQQNTLPGAATPVTTSYTYDKADRIQTAGSLSYAFDADGNVRSRTPSGGSATTYAYDQANRLTGTTTGGVTSSYIFDGDGKRVSRTVGGVTTSQLYDTTGSLPMLLDDGQRKYVYGPSGVIYEVDKASGSPYVLHTDAQGSVRVIIDSLGNVIETYYNDEYGNPLITLSASAPNNAAAQPLQHTAEPRDLETGFIYLRARMYDPSIGRFLQEDPKGLSSCTLGLPRTMNLYVYAGNNPLSAADPTGLQAASTATDWSNENCPKKRAEIQAKAGEVQRRFNQLNSDWNELRIYRPYAEWYGQKDTYQGHVFMFQKEQKELKDMIDDFFDKCNDPNVPWNGKEGAVNDVIIRSDALRWRAPSPPPPPAPPEGTGGWTEQDFGYDWGNLPGDLNNAIRYWGGPPPIFPLPLPPLPAFP
ncbi:MAG: hypothetical protein QOF51_2737 [Chloroflexota bacterium]|nr:hypothetical protein [Chloroflexota bacterium]